jgi:hypothetical protein
MTLDQWSANYSELVAMISNAIVAISAIVVAVFAGIGLTEWKKELVGRQKLDVAKEVVRLVTELKHNWSRARRLPAPYDSPVSTQEPVMGGDGPPQLSEFYMYLREKIDTLRPTLQCLYEAAMEARALCGIDIDPQVRRISSCVDDLDSATYQYYIAHRCAAGRWDNSTEYGKRCWELFYLIFPRVEMEDELQIRMQQAIDDLLVAVRKAL